MFKHILYTTIVVPTSWMWSNSSKTTIFIHDSDSWMHERAEGNSPANGSRGACVTLPKIFQISKLRSSILLRIRMKCSVDFWCMSFNFSIDKRTNIWLFISIKYHPYCCYDASEKCIDSPLLSSRYHVACKAISIRGWIKVSPSMYTTRNGWKEESITSRTRTTSK